MALTTDPVDTNLMQAVTGVTGTSAEVTVLGYAADPAQGMNATRFSFNGGYAVLTRLGDSATLAGNTYDFELWLRTDTAGVIAVVYVTDNIVGSGDNTLGTLITNQWQNYRWTSRYPSASNVTEGVMVLNTNIPCTIEVYRYSAYKKRIAPVVSVSGNVGETGYTMPSGSIFKLQADLTTGISTGGTIATILDRSGNSTDATAAVGNATYNIVTAKPAIRFGGSSYYNVPFAFTTKPAAWTIVVVAGLTSKSYQFICGSADSVGTDKDTWGIVGETSTALLSEFGDGTNYNYSVSGAGVLPTSSVNRLVVRYVASSAAADSHKNGAAVTMSTSGGATSTAGAAQPFSIGNDGANLNTAIYLLGDLYFLQIWPRALTNTELAAVESSLISAGF